MSDTEGHHGQRSRPRKAPGLVRRALTRGGIVAAALGLPLGALALGAAPASAANGMTQFNCQVRTTNSTPFKQWGDTNQYFPLVGGQLESTPITSGWGLGGWTSIVGENEPWKVAGATDSHSLEIGPGASAFTQQFCVYPNEPSVRFFVKKPGVKGATLTVSVSSYFSPSAGLWDSKTTQTTTYTIDGSTAGWAPTPIYQLPQKSGSVEAMATITMHASAGGGDWQVDDFEVDPWRSN